MSEFTALSLYKKKRAKIRLTFLLLDIFLGGFIVGIVLMITLGRPENESPSIGSGGHPFVLVEFYWDKGLHLYSPEIYYSTDLSDPLTSNYRIHGPGFASPWGFPGNSIWLQHDVTTGYLNIENINFPAQKLGMDGFHLEGVNSSSVETSERNTKVVHQNYGYLWIEQPCYGKWKFALRHVEEPLDNSPMNVGIKVSYSYGDKKNESNTLDTSSNPQSVVTSASTSLYETVAGFNAVEIPLDSEVLRRPECPSS